MGRPGACVKAGRELLPPTRPSGEAPHHHQWLLSFPQTSPRGRRGVFRDRTREPRPHPEAWLQQGNQDWGAPFSSIQLRGRTASSWPSSQHGPLTTLGPMTFSPDQGTPVPGTHCARHNWSCITSGSGSEFAFLLSHSSARSSTEGRGSAAAAWSSGQLRDKAWEWS